MEQAGLPNFIDGDDAIGATVFFIPAAYRWHRSDDIYGHCAGSGISFCREVIRQLGRTKRLAAICQCHCDDRIIFAVRDCDALVDRKTLELF